MRKLLRRYHAECCRHPVMSKPAHLRAKYGVFAGRGRREMNMDYLARHSILFQTKLRHAEPVDDIERPQAQINLAPDRQHKLRGNKIVSPGVIRGI